MRKPPKMVRHIRSPHGYGWRRLQVKVGRKWETVMDIEDDVDSCVAPIQRAFDAVFADASLHSPAKPAVGSK